MSRCVYMVFLLLGQPALAQDGPSFTCAQADGTVEKLICADDGLAQLDRRVADRFLAAIAIAESLGGADQAVSEVRAYQRGWIKGRNACWTADDPRDCVQAAYLRREGELVARWMLEPATGTARWVCGGNPANDLVTTFFDTELPSVRFERGDRVDTGSLGRTASGARYDGSFGRFIWIKGNEATYRDPDPDGTTYLCEMSEAR